MDRIDFSDFIDYSDYTITEDSILEDINNIPMLESEYDFLLNNQSIDILDFLNEESYMERAKTATFQVEVLDVNKFVKANNLKEIANPTFFNSSGQPTSDGLLSNEIFGISEKDRSGIFAYIDLGEYFIDPSCYKVLKALNSKIAKIVKGLGRYSIGEDGDIIEDPEKGQTGIKWLKDNFSKIKFKRSKSIQRDLYIRYIDLNYSKGNMFINKYIVIPPYYRDVNTSGKYTGVGQINTLYVNLIVAARSLKENNDYGLSMADTTCGRIQDTLMAIYDWFCGNRNATMDKNGAGLAGKTGIIRRANMSYTSDYSSRLVLSAPELKAESVDDLMVSLDKSACPLAAVAADFYPAMIFHMRKFFENELLNATSYETVVNGEPYTVKLNNPMMAFSDTVLKDQLKYFLHSYDNRFIPVILPTEEGYDDRIFFMWFKGERWLEPNEAREGVEQIVQRPLTWVDVIYIAAKKATEDKTISFTRFPYDSYFNTIYTGIEVASTKETEPLYVNGEFYKFYPKIRADEILKSTGQKFVDTMQVSNLYLKGMGADYDGDTGVMKGSFFKETNEELHKLADSKKNYINLGCENIRVSSNEAIQALYSFTKILESDTSKLTNPEF